MVNLSKVKVISAQEVEPKKLETFHTEVCSDRSYSIFRLFGWLYRPTFHKNKIPIVALYLDKVIAHARMIPFNEEFSGSKRKASWFIDFIILPKFQCYGLGTVLTKKWMEFSFNG